MTTTAVTIDPPGARELDDAIAVRGGDDGWTVEVLLPDVPSALRPGTPVDDAARDRGLTVYAADAVRTPMLPPAMVEALSLSSMREGPVVAITIELARDLTPRVASVLRTKCRTAARLSYAEADLAIADPDHEHHEALAPIWDLARRLHADRAAGTGARFDIDEHIFTNEEGQVVALDDRHAHRSNMAVMEIMILANAALAGHAAAEGLPVLYRNHRHDGAGRGDRASCAAALALRDGIGRREAAQRLKAMAHLVGPAEIGTAPLGHFGLDLAAYAWFTSPLRRYCDVVNLRALLDGHAERDLPSLADRLTGLHRRQKELSSDHHGRTARRRLVALLAREQHDRLDDADVHTILRALAENPDAPRESSIRHLRRRMGADEMSGRDICELEREAAHLLGDDFAAEVKAWIDERPARRILFEEHQGATTAPTMPDDATSGAKADLQIVADRHRARLDYAEPRRTGPPHAPVFDVELRWTGSGVPMTVTGTGRSKRAAENAAAAAMIARLPAAMRNGGAPAKSAAPKAPKTELLERATARRSTVSFGDAKRTGPDHEPRFEVEAVWRSVEGEIRVTGAGTGKKDAERDASEKLLATLDGREGGIPR